MSEYTLDEAVANLDAADRTIAVAIAQVSTATTCVAYSDMRAIHAEQLINLQKHLSDAMNLTRMHRAFIADEAGKERAE